MSAIQFTTDRFLWSQANIALQTWRPSPRKSACFARSPALCEALGHQQSPVRWRLNPFSLSSLCDRTDAKRPPHPNRLHWYLYLPWNCSSHWPRNRSSRMTCEMERATRTSSLWVIQAKRKGHPVCPMSTSREGTSLISWNKPQWLWLLSHKRFPFCQEMAHLPHSTSSIRPDRLSDYSSSTGPWHTTSQQQGTLVRQMDCLVYVEKHLQPMVHDKTLKDQVRRTHEPTNSQGFRRRLLEPATEPVITQQSSPIPNVGSWIILWCSCMSGALRKVWHPQLPNKEFGCILASDRPWPLKVTRNSNFHLMYWGHLPGNTETWNYWFVGGRLKGVGIT